MRSPLYNPVILLAFSIAAILVIVPVVGDLEQAWRADYLSRIQHGTCPVYGNFTRPCTLDDYRTNLAESWWLPSRWPFVFAYVLYADAAVWVGILLWYAFGRAQTEGVRLWHTFWLIFVPICLALPLLDGAVSGARRAALIDASLMFRYEHILFYAEPLLLIPAAALVWFAPEGNSGPPWRPLARAAVTVITISSLWIQILALLFLGFKDS